MTELTYFLLKMAFLALMWFFVFSVVFAIRTDLFGPRVRVLARADRKKRGSATEPASASTPVPPSFADTAAIPRNQPPAAAAGDPSVATASSAKRLAIIEGPRAGHEFALDDTTITIGRSLESSLVLRDDYTSTNHARIFLRNGTWMLEDQGSTNGTLFAGERIHVPTPITLNTPISIGTSVLELRP